MLSQFFKKIRDKQNFVIAQRILLVVGVLIFLMSLTFYSPSADGFSFRSSFWTVAIVGILLAAMIYFIGIIITALLFLPKEMFFSKENHFHWDEYEKEMLWSKTDDTAPYVRDDWHNDATNPASPVYQAIHRRTDQFDHL